MHYYFACLNNSALEKENVVIAEVLGETMPLLI